VPESRSYLLNLQVFTLSLLTRGIAEKSNYFLLCYTFTHTAV
jgi:hypothetical protein